MTENNIIQDEVGWIYISLIEMSKNKNIYVESIEDEGEEFAVLTCTLDIAEEQNVNSSADVLGNH
jgi:hypothetical protein